MMFADKLRLLIEGKEQAKIAEAVGVAPSALSNYLNRKSMPSVKTALSLSKLFECSLFWLVDDSLDYSSRWPRLSIIPDNIFMDEACRRLIDQAKRVGYDLERVTKENWPKVADELLAIPASNELPLEHDRIDFLLSLLFSAHQDLRAFDATQAIRQRPNNGPDWDDLTSEINDLVGKTPEFMILKSYFELRHLADYMKRHNATQADWDMRDVEGQRKQLIASLAKARKASKAAKP